MLEKLFADNNRNINNVYHLANTLIVLDSSFHSRINHERVKKLKRRMITLARLNKKITNKNHLTNSLIELECTTT